MWQEKQDNIILPGQVPYNPSSHQGPHGGNKILPPPSGNYDLGGSSRKRKSTAMDSPGAASEYHFPWESNPRDGSSHLGLRGQGNNSGAYLNQANSAEPLNFRPHFDKNNCGVYLNQANFGHQFNTGHLHYPNNSSETWPTRNTDFNGTGIATTTNASYTLPPQSLQHKGFLPSVEMPVGEPFTVPNQQSQAGYVFGQTESNRSLPFPKSSNSDSEKSQSGPNLHDLINSRNKNYAMWDKMLPEMCNTSFDCSRPVEIFQQNFVQPKRFSDGLNVNTCSKEDNKFETSCATTQGGHCLNNAGIVNLPTVGMASLGASICPEQVETNRLLENEVNFVSTPAVIRSKDSSESKERSHREGDIKIKETAVASDMENPTTSLTDDLSSKNIGSHDNIVAEGQGNDQSDGLLKLDDSSKSPCGKTASTVAEKLWDGSLQLNSSVTVSAVAFFKSGEKLLDTNWSELVEVKGKVRLEAFEKYIQDLPRSRNRGLMVISLYWKEGSSDSGLSGMKEVSKGYRKGGRVGFAHLSPGVDIYICPRSDTIITILAKYGFFKGMAAIEDNRDSLIGCVVWRKNRTSSNSDAKKGDSKNSVVSEPPLNSPSGSFTQQVSEKKMSPTQPAQRSNQTLENAGENGTKKKKNESSEAQNEVVKSSVDAITLPTQVYSPIQGSHGHSLEAEKPNMYLERQNPVVTVQSNVVEQSMPTSDDDDLPEYDFGMARGVSIVPMSKPLDVAVSDRRLPAEGIVRNMDRSAPPTIPVVQAMSVSSQISDTSSVAANRSAPNQGKPPWRECHVPVSRNLDEENLQRKASQTNAFESPKNSFDELPKKKNLFDDDDDDDDMPEWCPPKLHKQPLAEPIQSSTPHSSALSSSTFQNMSPGPPRAPLPSPSQAAAIRPSSALPSTLLSSTLQNMSPRPLLPSPSSAATRAPFSYQPFRPTFHSPTITSVKSPPPMPFETGPRSSMGFNSNSVPRPQSNSDIKLPFQYSDRRRWRP